MTKLNNIIVSYGKTSETMYLRFSTFRFVATKQEGKLRAQGFLPNCLGNRETNVQKADTIGAMGAFAASTALAGIFSSVSNKRCFSGWSRDRRIVESSESASQMQSIVESCLPKESESMKKESGYFNGTRRNTGCSKIRRFRPHLWLILTCCMARSISSLFAVDALPSIKELKSTEVQAGGGVTVYLDAPLAKDLTLVAQVGDKIIDTVQLLPPDRTEVVVGLPLDVTQGLKSVVDLRLKLFALSPGVGEKTPLDGQFLLRIYPRTGAEVLTIDDNTAKIVPPVYVGYTFTVHGNGFFAPANEIIFSVDGIAAETRFVADDGKSFTAVFSASQEKKRPAPGEWPFTVRVWGREAGSPNGGDIVIEDYDKLDKVGATLWAAVPVAFFGLVLYVLSFGIRRSRERIADATGGAIEATHSWWEVLLVDSSTNTYSLARLQFLLWLFVLVYAYGFVFAARAYVADEWKFPELAGAQLAFCISLGTLVGSVATTALVGLKGAGGVAPAFRDFLVQGGVVALDRVQQLLWTIVAIFIFITILYKTGGVDRSLPSIPNELLSLMGVSSVGYLAGKAVRRAGPNIHRVELGANGAVISGVNLSTGARVFLGGKEQPKVSIEAGEGSLNRQGDFVDELLVKLIDKDLASLGTVCVINPDGQEATWEDKAKDNKES